MFGGSSTTTYHLFGNQFFASGVSLDAWVAGGFPNYSTDFAVEVAGFRLGGGTGALTAGDFYLRAMDLPSLDFSVADYFPVRGFRLEAASGDTRWSVFAGRARYQPTGFSDSGDRPVLAGGTVSTAWGGGTVGFSLTAVDRPVFAVAGQDRDRAAVLSASYVRPVSPLTSLYGELLTTDAGGLGGRAGALFRFVNSEVSSEVFGFALSFPQLDPYYRPGEKGIAVDYSYRLSEQSRVFTDVSWVDSTDAGASSSLRGTAGIGTSLGAGAPYLQLSVGRNDVTFASDSIGARGGRADRAELSLSQSSRLRDLYVDVQYVASNQASTPDRSQGLFRWRQLVGLASFVTGSAVVQHESGRGSGGTGEVSLDFPFRGPYRMICGLGAAVRTLEGTRSGEGIARIGFSRNVGREGWWIRLEAVRDFSIGMERANLNPSQFLFDVGRNLSWRSIGEIRSVFAPILTPGQYGSIEGTVTMDGEGRRGVTILADGSPRAVSGSDGSFRISRVPVGTVTVSVDLRGLGPRISVKGGAARQVTVTPRGTARAAFELAETSYFQGSVVRCSDGGLVPVIGAKVTVTAGSYSRTVTTSAMGGFQLDDIPPGTVEVTVDATGVDEALPVVRERVDLSGDVGGYVVRLGCPAS